MGVRTLMDIDSADLGHGDGYRVKADEAGMVVTQKHGNGEDKDATIFIDPDTFAKLLTLARFLGWEGAE